MIMKCPCGKVISKDSPLTHIATSLCSIYGSEPMISMLETIYEAWEVFGDISGVISSEVTGVFLDETSPIF